MLAPALQHGAPALIPWLPATRTRGRGPYVQAGVQTNPELTSRPDHLHGAGQGRSQVEAGRLHRHCRLALSSMPFAHALLADLFKHGGEPWAAMTILSGGSQPGRSARPDR